MRKGRREWDKERRGEKGGGGDKRERKREREGGRQERDRERDRVPQNSSVARSVATGDNNQPLNWL